MVGQQHSPLLGLDIRTRQAQTLEIPAQAGWEYGVLVFKGEVEIDGQTLVQDELENLLAPPPKPYTSAPKQAATSCCWAANPCRTRR